MTYFKFCKKCEKRFNPKTKHSKICENCLKDVKNVNFIKLICYRKDIDLNKLKKFW